MENVKPLKEAVNSTLAEVETWARLMAERGEYAANTARHYVTALKRLTSVLGPQEPSDPVRVLEMIEDLGRRWGVKEGGKPETISTYVSRARTLLSDYISYQENPAKFRGRSRRSSPKTDGGAKSKSSSKVATRKEAPKEPSPTPPSQDPNASSRSSRTRSIPLGDGREFEFAFEGELTKEQALKVGVSLLMMCPDFTTEDVAKLARLAQ